MICTPKVSPPMGEKSDASFRIRCLILGRTASGRWPPRAWRRRKSDHKSSQSGPTAAQGGQGPTADGPRGPAGLVEFWAVLWSPCGPVVFFFNTYYAPV